MTIATNVLSWSIDNDDDDDEDDDGYTDAERNEPFKVELDPTPVVGQDYSVRVYASSANTYGVSVIGAGDTSESNYTVENGIYQQEESTISGGGFSTNYPVRSIDRIQTISGIYDQAKRVFIHTPGSVLSISSYSAINGAIVMADQERYADAIGSVLIDYITTDYKKVNGFSGGVGTAFITGYRGSNYQTIQLDLESDVVAQTLEIRDYCTDEVIPGAAVNVDGTGYTTDANGLIVLGLLEAGQTLPVVTTASGYHDSDADTLNNDEITT